MQEVMNIWGELLGETTRKAMGEGCPNQVMRQKMEKSD